MRWLRVLVMGSVIGIAALAAGGYVLQLREPVHYVLTDREAIAMVEGFGTEMVAPRVVMAEWSASGRHVLAVRLDLRLPSERWQELWRLPSSPELTMPGDISLVLWNRDTHRSYEVWHKSFHEPEGAISIERIHWLPGREVAVVVARWEQPSPQGSTEHHRVLLRVDAGRRQVQPVAQLKGTDEVMISPVYPAVILVDSDEHILRIMRTDGSLGQPVRLPGSIYLPGQWSRGGQWLTFQDREKQWYAVDIRSGEMQGLPEAPRDIYEPKPHELPVRLHQTKQIWKDGQTAYTFHPLWLESVSASEKPRALVSIDCEWGKLSPDGSAVLYSTQGAAWVRYLISMPQEEMLRVRSEALREATLSNAKQLGTALMMYIQDYDERLPMADVPIKDLLFPYARDEDFFLTPGTGSDGFVYLGYDRPLSDIGDPAGSVVGYLQGPGGRAIIFADGHVEWQE